MESQTLLIKNQGVQIILNRMQSHPEEFVDDRKFANIENNRWSWVVEKVITRVEHKHQTTSSHGYRIPLPFLTNDEVDALYDKYMSIQGEAFTHRVMRELLEDDPSPQLEPNTVRFTTTERFRTGRAQAFAMIVTKEEGTTQQGGLST